MSPRFELQLDRERCAPGETIRGTIRVLEGSRSRSLQVLLEYKEETEDYAAVATGVSSGPLHTGDLTTGMSFRFELTLPLDGWRPALVGPAGSHETLRLRSSARPLAQGTGGTQARDGLTRCCRIRVEAVIPSASRSHPRRTKRRITG